MKKVLYTFMLLFIGTASFAQEMPRTTILPEKKLRIRAIPRDGFSARTDVDSNVVIPYANVREEDVYYSKRIWREVDLTDTVNSVLNNDRYKLIQIFLDAIALEELTAYSPKDTAQGRVLEDDDSFKIALTPNEAMNLARGTTEGVIDENTGKLSEPTLRRLRPDEFSKYRIKEDWILDVKRAVFEPRIIGIAPMKMVEGNWQPVFWIYFDDAREILSTKRLQNPNNDASVMTYDDFFVRRLFTSTIVKETNPGNKSIMEIIGATDANDPRVIVESDRINQSLKDFEQRIWKY
ncbi:gliding motility associated protein GldN [Pedobacter sp. CAN_A7]|uniref:type IX secretion system ring protein PorN/GldN n=1 Tax=Pedobacter sp. CAN_A7 TaxID=2787722 RepID=UPI0018CBBE5C